MAEPFYEEFMIVGTKDKSSDGGQGASIHINVNAGLSADSIMQKVSAVVASVIGTSVSVDNPLVEAGLDSLGNPHLKPSQCLCSSFTYICFACNTADVLVLKYSIIVGQVSTLWRLLFGPCECSLEQCCASMS